MTTRIRKLRALEQSISRKMGEFELFAVISREGKRGWELVASAPWLDSGLSGTQFLATQLHKVLSRPQLSDLAGIVILEPDSPFAAALRRQTANHADRHGELTNVNVAGIAIARAYVLDPATRAGSRLMAG